ncbi:MAG: outer membrane beta-barrel protein [Candidatus Aminicenantes bacterium]|nr:outer membrane beta-barrel protein [Candidatus Aminicenantes bacterium]
MIWSLLLIPSTVSAQTYLSFRSGMEQIVRQTWIKFGPFRLLPRFRLRDVGYDGNVYYQREEDEPVSDYTATLSPEIGVNVLFRNYLILKLRENPEYVYYLAEKRERRWNNVFSPEFKLLLFHRFTLGWSYTNSRRRRRATSEFDVRANEYRKEYKGSFFYETARETSLGLMIQQAEITYEDITTPGEEIYLSRRLNRRETSAHGEFYYRVFSASFFFLKGGYTDYKFLHEEARDRDAYSYQGYIGLRFPALGKVRGLVSLGYKRLVPRREGVKGFAGLVGNSEVQYRLWRFVLRTGFLRDSIFSYWTNNLYFIETSLWEGASFYLSRRLRLDYRFRYGEGRYPEPMPMTLPEGGVEYIKRRDIYRTHTVGLVFRVYGTTGVGVQAVLWERKTNYRWENRRRFFVGAYVTYEF